MKPEGIEKLMEITEESADASSDDAYYDSRSSISEDSSVILVDTYVTPASNESEIVATRSELSSASPTSHLNAKVAKFVRGSYWIGTITKEEKLPTSTCTSDFCCLWHVEYDNGQEEDWMDLEEVLRGLELWQNNQEMAADAAGRKQGQRSPNQPKTPYQKISSYDYKYKNARIACFFDLELYCGTVVGYNDTYWKVKYDDGDGEDMNKKEVEKAIALWEEERQRRNADPGTIRKSPRKRKDCDRYVPEESFCKDAGIGLVTTRIDASLTGQRKHGPADEEEISQTDAEEAADQQERQNANLAHTKKSRERKGCDRYVRKVSPCNYGTPSKQRQRVGRQREIRTPTPAAVRSLHIARLGDENRKHNEVHIKKL